MSSTSSTTLRESLAYTPCELTFGTSGLRGRVEDITQLEAWINSRGFLEYLIATGAVRTGDTVCLAGDLRPSTDRRVPEQGGRGEILQAVARAIEDTGLQVRYLGRIPTPALVHFATRRRMASVMVTGSHIPFDRNGIKFNTPAGEVLKADEAPILERVRQVRVEAYARPAGRSPFDVDGMLRTGQRRNLPPVDPTGERDYVGRYREAFPGGNLRGRRILVYQHSALARDLLVDLLAGFGAEVVAAGRSETFLPIDTEAVNADMLRGIQELVNTHGGAALEAVVSTDGDSDRPLVLGVDDGRVRFFPGDLLGLVVAEFLGARHAAVPVSANDAVDRHCAAKGITLAKTRIGSPYVIAAMQEVGWEANGGFLTAKNLRVPRGGALDPLPTRDALLPICAALHASLGRGLTLADLFGRLPRRFGKSDLLRPFARETSDRLLDRFAPRDSSIEHVVFRGDTVEVRGRDGREERLPATAERARDLHRCREQLQMCFTTAGGFGPVETINLIDGVRVGFANGDVVHLRPSGNAPELRVYANADTPQRAEEIARLATAEDGIVRRMAAEVQMDGALAAILEGPSALPLRGRVRHYAWGGRDFLPQLLGIPNPDRQPFAEYWLGTHPAAPSEIRVGEVWLPSPELLRRAGLELLGAEAVRRFGLRLPYLFKVLEVRTMLSIQAHPTRSQAVEGFAREEAAGIDRAAPHRNYRDTNHKPEVHVALTEFWMLHGFRPLEAIAETLRDVPELRPLMPDFVGCLRRAGPDPVARQVWLRHLYERAMTLSQDEIDRLLEPLLRRLERDGRWPKTTPEFWALRAARELPLPGGHCDRGLISVFLLNLVRLDPGQGTFQAAGTLHAYLEGVTVELMADSDNVLRGGLTPKHIDVPELLRVVRFVEGQPETLEGRAISPTETWYPTPCDEFLLARIGLQAGQSHAVGSAHGPECYLVTDGSAVVQVGAGDVRLKRGEAILLPAGLAGEIRASAPAAVLYRAGVP